MTHRPATTSMLASVLAFAIAAGCSDSAVHPIDPGGQDTTPDPPVQETGDITVDAGTKYQTIVGWEAHGQAGEDDFPEFPLYADTLLSLAANDLGINRIRLEIQSGLENTQDNYKRNRDGLLSQEQFRCLRWVTVNDNSDPEVLNPAGFHWTQLDRRMERVIIPMQKKLAARGEKLYINLTYVAFDPRCAGSTYVHEDPREYAEMILAAFLHMKNRWGVVPDAVEVLLEPDNTHWKGTKIGQALVAAAKRLEANGFHPEFIAPSNTNMAKALTYFDEMMAVPEVSKYLTEFAYHRYQAVSAANLQGIVDRARQHGLRTSMLELLRADYEVLHEDLKKGQVSAWQQFALSFGAVGNGGNVYIGVDRSNPAKPVVLYPERTRFLRQYFKFVRAGARRIEATSTKAAFDPVAFVNTNGGHVVVVKAKGGGNFTIAGLPAGSYGIKYTTSAEFDVDLPNVDLAAGKALAASIPAAGVVTIYAR